MTPEKFEADSATLYRFIKTYCDNKHSEHVKLESMLCAECDHTLNYATQRLKECSYEIKPSCRDCKTNCYEKGMRKKMAQIMMYSGMRLGLTRLRKMFFK